MRRAAIALAGMALAAGIAQAEPSGPDRPPEGRALLDAIFADGPPFPFEALLDRLRALAGAKNVQTALIPVGRSLQRFAAAPDYFASPRLIVAVTGDRAAGPADPRLADRLFLGYQPAAEVIEAISYNAEAGRFEFQEVVGYAADRRFATHPAERKVCLACHQGAGPILARPLWDESNANAAIARRLAAHAPSYHGAPARQTVDVLETFDAATDRAALVAPANRLWAEGCPDAPCRAGLLIAALRYGLSGGLTGRAPFSPARQGFDAASVALWPDGLAVISPDLPNQVVALEPAGAPLLDPPGAMNPEAPRAATVVWRPDARGFDEAARLLAARFTPGDFTWLDRRLRAGALTGREHRLTCETRAVRIGKAQPELRFACEGDEAALAGFVLPDGRGRLTALAAAGAPPLRNIAVRAVSDAERHRIVVQGLSPRLGDGQRIAGLTLGADDASFHLIDDLGPLGQALEAQADAAALGAGPFRRQAVLALIDSILGGVNG